MKEVLNNHIVANALQYIHVSSHHMVHLKFTHCYMSIISQLNKKKSYAMNREKKYKYSKPILVSSLYVFSEIKYLRRDNSFVLD